MDSNDTLTSPIMCEDKSNSSSTVPAPFPVSIYSSVENSRNPVRTGHVD